MAKQTTNGKPAQAVATTSKAHELVSEIQGHSWEHMLPPHISKDRFVSAALACLRQTAGIEKATTKSIKNALIKAAQDGLLPDGREGVVTVYKDIAQWNPMAYGLRKRARELDSIIVDAQAFYENDTDGQRIIYELGDEPRIVHRPALGDRGKLCGAYAIFRKGTEILFREVMDADQIEKTRRQSKAPDSLMWDKFTEEAYRKTVVRRGFKSVPCSPPLERIVQRNDDDFDFVQPDPQVREIKAARTVETMIDQFADEPDDEKTIEHEPEVEQAVSGEIKPYPKDISSKNSLAIMEAMKEATDGDQLNDVVINARDIYTRLTFTDQKLMEAALAKRAKMLKVTEIEAWVQ